jgi:2,3-diaminopropionate biosynthesis protein SbnB
MRTDDMLILKGEEVHNLLARREPEIIEAVGRAYLAHGRGESSLPHSVFLRFPGGGRERIIALPAYLGGGFDTAGVKWVSSFPGNLERGLDRASAVLILNSTETGRPVALMEGSIVSAKRTAASAALAASVLQPRGARAEHAGLVGCGLINYEVAAFLAAACPEVRRLTVYDLDAARAEAFAAKCRERLPEFEIEVAKDLATLLRECPLVSFATTAVKPHVADLSACAPGATILHVSLRDLTPEAVLKCENIADDVDHVCRAETSLHLAEQATGTRDFIRGTLADVLGGRIEPRGDDSGVCVFSPFGLGILDLAVGQLALNLAAERGVGLVLNSFVPRPWQERDV